MSHDWGVKVVNPLTIFLAVWAATPFSLGAAIDSALREEVVQRQMWGSIAFWIVWGFVLGCSILRRPWGLTMMRVFAPAMLLALFAAHLYFRISTGILVVALVHTAVVSLLALLPETGNIMIDGISYGDERRFLLRIPSAILIGPLALVWGIVILGVFSGPIFVASDSWRLGMPLLVVGWPIAAFGCRSIHQLARRWIVFVPNGFVIHDYLATREPFLIRRQDTISLGPAPADVDIKGEGVVDVSQFALGPVLQVTLHGEVEVVPRSRGVSEVKLARTVLFSPTRPGAVLQEARRRGLVR
ncbi:MAG: hypothetical protein QGH80_06695 [Acidimicrobiales bacterium]|jgi:hypothetical protein|nr:hypothetical protein [Acidimicrobiales bacterium]